MRAASRRPAADLGEQVDGEPKLFFGREILPGTAVESLHPYGIKYQAGTPGLSTGGRAGNRAIIPGQWAAREKIAQPPKSPGRSVLDEGQPEGPQRRGEPTRLTERLAPGTLCSIRKRQQGQIFGVNPITSALYLVVRPQAGQKRRILYFSLHKIGALHIIEASCVPALTVMRLFFGRLGECSVAGNISPLQGTNRGN